MCSHYGSHVAVINYFYTFALGMWVLSRHQSSQLLWCLCTVNSRPPRDQHPCTPQQPRTCPCSVFNQAVCNWCESQGLIILGLATTLQQNPSPLFSGPAGLRMDIYDWVEPLTDLSLILQKTPRHVIYSYFQVITS